MSLGIRLYITEQHILKHLALGLNQKENGSYKICAATFTFLSTQLVIQDLEVSVKALYTVHEVK